MCSYQSLKSLALAKTNLTDDGVLAIVRALLNGNSSLTELDLSANNISNKSASAIGELFESNHALKNLNLSWNTIKVRIPQNQIAKPWDFVAKQSAGASSLAKGLMANESLQHLDLSWNGLENEGAIQLGEMLSINLGLKSLNLMHTRTGTEGSLVIAEGLRVQPVTIDSTSPAQYLGQWLPGRNLA